MDIHATKRTDGGGYSNQGFKARPYQILFRSLVAKDVEGLLIAGRCISGDFFAHASYRVTGNAVAMGEAAGIAAAHSARENISTHAPPLARAQRLSRNGPRRARAKILPIHLPLPFLVFLYYEAGADRACLPCR